MRLWSDATQGKVPFGTPGNRFAHLDAVESIKEWTRLRFGLSERDVVVVSEVACSMPGFPPLETGVAFWTGEGIRHHFRVFKPVEQIAESDLPPQWLKDSLAASDGIECYCC